MILEVETIKPLSPSRLDLPTIQTDFKTNQLTLDQSEAELRAKVGDIIVKFNNLTINIGSIMESIEKNISKIVNDKLNEMLTNGELGELINNEIVTGKQDKVDNSLTTDSKSVVGAITEVQDLAKSKSKIILEEGTESFSGDITFEIVEPRDELGITQVNPK